MYSQEQFNIIFSKMISTTFPLAYGFILVNSVETIS